MKTTTFSQTVPSINEKEISRQIAKYILLQRQQEQFEREEWEANNFLCDMEGCMRFANKTNLYVFNIYCDDCIKRLFRS